MTEVGAESVLCVLSTTSCFAPRGVDIRRQAARHRAADVHRAHAGVEEAEASGDDGGEEGGVTRLPHTLERVVLGEMEAKNASTASGMR